jgi:hypothetical protein
MAQLLDLLEVNMVQAGVPGVMMFDLFVRAVADDVHEATRLLLGKRPDFPCCPGSMEPDVFGLECAKAMWLFDKISKNYISRCWKARTARQGSFTIKGGQLVCIEPATPSAVFAAPRCGVAGISYDKSLSHEWLAHIPKPSSGSRARNSAANFYVVWVGRSTGIFHKYSSVHALVSGFPGAKFKGFDSLEKAQVALRRGPN